MAKKLLKSMPPVEKVATRNTTDAAYQPDTPVSLDRPQTKTSMRPTFAGDVKKTSTRI